MAEVKRITCILQKTKMINNLIINTMKNLKLITILAMIFMLNVASMCSKDDDDSNSNSSSSSTPTQVTSNVSSGTWKVTLYNEDGVVKTSNLSEYDFTFGASNALSATNGTVTQSGNWTTYSDSGSTKMDLGFTATSGDFESISEDWRVLSSTSSKIELKHISGGDGSIDLLTFEKN